MNETENAVRRILGYTAEDRDFWERELAGFVPEQIFDAHVHLWHNSFASSNKTKENDWGNLNTTAFDLLKMNNLLFSGRNVGFLGFATPIRHADFNNLNCWVSWEISLWHDAFGAMLVTPDIQIEKIVQFIKSHKRFIALKPYYALIDNPPGSITDYLPEAHMEVANDYRLAIVLHLHSGPCSSLSELEIFTRKYPKIKWILAHCAASFAPQQLDNSISRLKNIPQLWYDTSAITNAATLTTLLSHISRKRILFATDNALGLGGCRHTSKVYINHTCYNTFKCYEQLLAMRHACDHLNVPQHEVKDIFYNNIRNIVNDILSLNR